MELRDRAAASLVHFHAHIYVDPADVAGTTPAWKEFYGRIAATFKDHKCVSGRPALAGDCSLPGSSAFTGAS